jgi:hypothetical protein
MPFDVLGAADGTATCRNELCRGNREPQRVSARLIVRTWTTRVADGPVTIARTEQLPVDVDPRPCPFCGGETEIGPLTTPPHHRLVWPVPTVRPGAEADEVLPDPTPPMTLEERVEQLERTVTRLAGRIDSGW